MDLGNRSLLAGRTIIVAIGIIFVVFSIIVAITPLRGEEDYVGTSFADLQATNPRLANAVWHYTTGIGIILLGVNLLIVVLAWKGLSRGSSLAWYSILLLSLTFLVGLFMAHVPIGHTSFAHIGIPSILTAIYFVGLAVSAKTVLSKK